MTVPDSLSEHGHKALRADIRRLSTMLGQTIALHGGPDLLELVERVRKESRAAIASGDDAAISALLAGLDSGTAVWLARAFSQSTADTLTQLMIGSENNGSGEGKIPGVQIASKTGTAEWGASPKTNPPHTWYDAFGPVPNPQIAVSVIVERGGNRGEEATGGSVASPIGRAVIAAALGSGS